MLLQSICTCAVHLLGFCSWSETDKLCKTELAPARKPQGLQTCKVQTCASVQSDLCCTVLVKDNSGVSTKQRSH